MEFKVNEEKGRRALACIQPRVVFINGIEEDMVNQFAKSFCELGFNVRLLQDLKPKQNDDENILISRIHNYIKRVGTAPTIIAGCIDNPDLLDRIFYGEHAVYTYVFMHINDVKSLRKRIHGQLKNNTASSSQELITAFANRKSDESDFANLLTNEAKRLGALSMKLYKDFLEELERCFVILY